jgi:anti-anti-sigma factor
VTSWSVLTSHARVLLCIARDPGVRLRGIAAGPGSTERSAYGIVTDLTTAGYAAKQKDGRRNRYQRLRPRTPRRAWRMTGTSARMRPEAGKVILSPAFVIRVRDHRPVMASRPGPARRAQWRGSAGGAGCLPGLGVLSGGRRASSPGESGRESGEEDDAGASGTLNRAACGPAWLAAADHWASPSSPGLACCQAASAHAQVTRAEGGFPQPVVLGGRGLMAERGGTAVDSASARTRHGRVFSVLFILERELAAGSGPRLAAEAGRLPMFSADLSTRECDGHVVVALRGELDLVDAADVAAALAAAVAREPRIIVDLAGLEFIDCSGVAALARGRRHARQAGGDLLLAAPQQRVLRVVAITRLAGEFSVHASVEEAAGSAGRSRREAVPVPGRPSKIRWPRPAVRSGTRALGSGAR